MEKEQWKDEVLNSLQGIKRALPNEFLFTRIEAKLQTQIIKMPVWQLRLATAALILLLAINSIAIVKSSRQNESRSTEYNLTGFQSY